MLKKSKIIVAIMLVILVSLSSFAVALAYDDEDDNSNESVTPMSGVVVLPIHKDLRMPQGTLTPDAEFIFKTTLVKVDGNTDFTGMTNLPKIDDITISFDKEAVALAPGSDIKVVRETSKNIFEGITFPHAGEYVFDVYEVHNTNSVIDNPDTLDLMIYSNVAYRIQILVANNLNQNDLTISAVNIVTGTRDENGNVIIANEYDSAAKATQLIFQNDYVKTNEPENPDNPNPNVETDTTLHISKTVEGGLGNHEQYFNFNMTLTVPSIMVPAPTQFRAYFVNEDNSIVNDPVDLANNAAGNAISLDNGGHYIWVTVGSTTNFNLKHGQRLVFVDTPVGASYSVTEIEDSNYETTFKITTNGVAGQPVVGLETNTQFVGELQNKAAYTNEHNYTSPMGLAMDNLPFVILILLTIGALVTFTVVKVRKQRNYF